MYLLAHRRDLVDIPPTIQFGVDDLQARAGRMAAAHPAGQEQDALTNNDAVWVNCLQRTHHDPACWPTSAGRVHWASRIHKTPWLTQEPERGTLNVEGQPPTASQAPRSATGPVESATVGSRATPCH